MGSIPRSGTGGSTPLKNMFNFIKNWPTFPKWFYYLHPFQQHVRIPVTSHLNPEVLSVFLKFYISSWGAMLAYCCFNFHFTGINYVELILTFSVHPSLLWIVWFSIALHNFTELFFTLLLRHEICLYILHINAYLFIDYIFNWMNFFILILQMCFWCQV